MSTRTRATIEDLYNIPEDGKAEIINGKIVGIIPAGGMPGRASGSVSLSLRSYERERGGGYAFGDNIGFIVDLPNRDSFSPDAAWYTGELEGMKFLSGAPLLRLRSEARMTTGRPQNESWPQNAATTLPPELSLCGT